MDPLTNERSQRGAMRKKLLADSGFHNFDRRVQHLSDMDLIPEVKLYLYTANVEVLELDTSHPLRARVSYFPEAVFLHVKSPHAKFRWNRDQVSLGRAAILLRGRGTIEVTSEDPILRRGSSAYLVPPGEKPVTFRSLEHFTEFVILSIPARNVHTALPDYEKLSHSLKSRLPDTLLAPVYAFATGICSLAVRDVKDVSPLLSASEEVIMLALRLIGSSGGPKGGSLHSAAFQTILAEYREPELGIHDVASKLGVSSRTLQAAFKAENTTFTATLREVRAAAAKTLKDQQPRLKRSEVASIVGFGSVDALDRALQGKRSPGKEKG